jgi:oligosaccharide repeat unit polymerase
MEMYWLTFAFVVFVMAWSWTSFRNEFHPHFLLTIAIVALVFSNFLVVGYEDRAIYGIADGDLDVYQSVLLGITLAIIAGAWVLAGLFPIDMKGTKSLLFKAPPPSARAIFLFSLISWAILFLEVFKRVAASDWSFLSVVLYSFGPRAETPWGYGGRNVGDERFVFIIVKIVLPFAGLVFAYLSSFQRGWRRLLSIGGFLLAVLLMITYGSRTPVVATLLGFTVFHMYRPISRIRRLVLIGSMALVTVAIISAMYLYRKAGYEDLVGPRQQYEIRYHQDNNYYRAIRALDIASNTAERWDVAPFVVATLVTPIPRAIWPQKPTLLRSYWGNYKEEWQTISFIGELVAMFGPVGGSLMAILVGLLTYLGMACSVRTLRWPAGLIVYMMLILYAYMCLRSLLNIVQFSYLPAFALLTSWLIGQREVLRHETRQVPQPGR